MESVKKDGNLKRRLDQLENQLLALHASIAKKKEFATRIKDNESSDGTDDKKGKKGQRQPVHEIKVVRSRYQKTSERRLACNEELYEYLANLTKHIANGSNAVRKLANLSHLSESPTIKTILLPREYFYNFAPELKNIDANFALELSAGGGENPMLKLCKKFTKESQSRGCGCTDWKRSQVDMGHAETVGSVHLKRSPARSHDFNLEKRTERNMAVLEMELELERTKREDAEKLIMQLEEEVENMRDKMKKALQMKHKSTKAEEKSKLKYKLMVDRDQQSEQTSEFEKELTMDKHETVEDASDDRHASSERTLKRCEKTSDKSVQKEQESIFTSISDVKGQELEKQKSVVNEKQVQLDYKSRAEASESALKELQAQRDAENKAHSQEVIEMKKMCEQIESSKKKLQQDMAAEVEKLNEKHQLKVNELCEKLQNVNKIIEKCEDKIKRLVNENKAICKEMQEMRTQKKEKRQNFALLEKENVSYKNTVEEQSGLIDNLKMKLDQAECDLKVTESKKNIIQAELDEKVETINDLRAELSSSRDLIKIKDTMLDDQLDTIKTLKCTSEISKEQLIQQQEQNANYDASVKQLEEVNTKLRDKITHLEECLRKTNQYKTNHEKNITILRKLEKEICEQQKHWQMNMSKICKEKEDAVRTARFASKKLVQTVNDYELQIKAQKQIADLLKSSLNETVKKLEIANQQIEILNAQVWKSNQMSEHVKNDLQSKLKKACEVYTDLLEDCCTNTDEIIN